MDKRAYRAALDRLAGEGLTAAGVLTTLNMLQGEDLKEALKGGATGGLAWGTIGALWPGMSRLISRGVGKGRKALQRKVGSKDSPSFYDVLTAPGRAAGYALAGGHGPAPTGYEAVTAPARLLTGTAPKFTSYQKRLAKTQPSRKLRMARIDRDIEERTRSQDRRGKLPKAPRYADNVPPRPEKTKYPEPKLSRTAWPPGTPNWQKEDPGLARALHRLGKIERDMKQTRMGREVFRRVRERD